MAGITGLVLEEDITDFFDRKNVNHWIMFRFSSDKHIEVDQGGGTGWNGMITKLPLDEVRYVICNFGYISPSDKIQRSKLIFLMWAPESANIKEKLKVTMYCQEAKHLLSRRGIPISMQATDLSDVNTKMVVSKIKQHTTTF